MKNALLVWFLFHGFYMKKLGTVQQYILQQTTHITSLRNIAFLHNKEVYKIEEIM